MAGGVRKEDGHRWQLEASVSPQRGTKGGSLGQRCPRDGEAGRPWAGRTTRGLSARRAPRKAGVWWARRLGMGGPNPSSVHHWLSFSASGREHTKQGENKVYLQEMSTEQHQGNQTGPEGNGQQMPAAWALQSVVVAEDRFTLGVLQEAEDTVAIRIVRRLKCFSLTKRYVLMFKQNYHFVKQRRRKEALWQLLWAKKLLFYLLNKLISLFLGLNPDAKLSPGVITREMNKKLNKHSPFGLVCESKNKEHFWCC